MYHGPDILNQLLSQESLTVSTLSYLQAKDRHSQVTVHSKQMLIIFTNGWFEYQQIEICIYLHIYYY